MRKSILLFVLFTLLNIPLLLFAQGGYQVTGHIISLEDGEPMIGVSVVEKGTSNGVITDMNGNYSIKVTKSPATLQFSYIGMKTIEKQVTGSIRFDLKMENDAQQVDEVVVIAYGVRKKGTVTGSMSVVKAGQMENIPAPSFDQALQGKTPGLQVISNSGEPSATADFQIRGANSINSGTTPLFILDGITITDDVFSSINPNDIESISVLKDASSTSIYGARAANGVVVITTKRGRVNDNGQITVRAQYGVSKLAYGEWDLMNTTERLNFEEEIGIRKAGTYDRDLLERTNIDWRDVVYNDAAPLVSVDLQTSGATQNGFNYYVSGNVHSQEGIALGSDYKRYTLRANLEAKVNKWFKIGTNASFAYEDIQEATSGDYNTVTPISAIHFMLPYWNPYAPDGSIAKVKEGTWLGTNVNPLEYMDANPSDKNNWKIVASAFAELHPITGLTIKTLGGVDYLNQRNDYFSLPSYATNAGEGTLGRGAQRYINLTWSNTATYIFDVKNDHHFNVLLGQEWVDNQNDGFAVVGRGQSHDRMLTLSTGTRADKPSDTMLEARYLSFFSRVDYNYQNKYYADFSVRGDSSSRFGAGVRWGTFWSVGLMWNTKAEKFLKDIDWLTNAQLAGSIGTSGNSSIPAYYHWALVGGGPIYGLDGEAMAGMAPNSKGNEKLTWENTMTSNLSVKLGFLDRVNFVAEFYNKKTTDMLMEVPVSAVGGYTTRWSNMGAMVNRGVELSLDADILRLKGFRWNIFGNVSYNKNKITELYNGRDEYDLGDYNMFLKVGHDSRELYLNRFAGVNPVNGDALWYDKDGHITNEIKEEDKVLTGKSATAPWQGGFGTTLSWKGITVSAQFSWVSGRYMVNNDRFFSESNSSAYASYNHSRKMLYDRWKKPGDIVSIPRYDVPIQFDDRLLEDASFLRLKNLTISYDFPKSLLRTAKVFQHARVYAQGQNLFTWTKFQGMDPESTMNVYQAAYPMSRQFTVGLEVGF
ncbi:TonB-dependent receptor [Bacteroides sp. GM023]|uniref:SusC/RagA family TonB-linked outer membrane protein n=1 Tax=Bacteroides sp. GM023 TaxID=2723058 RepID=UPI00168BEB65|nr:TonB-dependent receptor [Bacteroides sp. GM023]MBD3590079.1 TonB-dependent receptor [Bacteroides sp. GM023]